MRLNFTLFFLLLLSSTADAQKITGIWRGYFSSSLGQSRDGVREEHYKYEIQIDQQANNGINGVTYSYKTTVFYGKAEISGIYNPVSKSLIIKENKLVDLKIGDKSEPCLMTCYLDYTRIGKLEVLEGTFISINVKDKGDCGSGKIYLEKVPDSDFKKEDFLTKKKSNEPAPAKPDTKAPANAKPLVSAPPVKKPGAKDNLRTQTLPPLTPARKTPQANTPAAPQKTPVPNTASSPKKQNGNTVKQPSPKPKDDKPVVVSKPVERVPEQPVNAQKRVENEVQPAENNTRKMPIPRVLVERENNLVRTITTSEENIVVELYDNGTIDNDTISVYHNNELAVSNARLNYTPITVKIKCSKTDSRHELTVVAENLGDIPPNTALMVIKAGGNKERYEIFLASTEQRNAKVVINYVPKDKP